MTMMTTEEDHEESNHTNYHLPLIAIIRNLSGLFAYNNDNEYHDDDDYYDDVVSTLDNNNNATEEQKHQQQQQSSNVIIYIYIIVVVVVGCIFVFSVGRLTYRCCQAVHRSDDARRDDNEYEEEEEEANDIDDDNDNDDDDYADDEEYGRLQQRGQFVDKDGNVIAQKPRRARAHAPKRYTFDNDQDDDGYTQISGLTFGYQTVDLMTVSPYDDQPTTTNHPESQSLLKASGYNNSNKNQYKYNNNAAITPQSQQEQTGTYVSGPYEYDLATIVHKQPHGYFSVFISIIQIITMIAMIAMNDNDSTTMTTPQHLKFSQFISDNVSDAMKEEVGSTFYGYAPIHDNPMIGPYNPQTNRLVTILVGITKTSTYGAIFDHGDWYRLLTPVLFHGGWIHILICVLLQLHIGYQFECEWGSTTYTIIYAISSMGATFLSLKLVASSSNNTITSTNNSVAIGASGAIMGLLGGKMAEVVYRCCETAITDRDYIGRDMRQRQCCIILPMVFIIMILSIVATNICPYIDYAYQLGGFLFGFCIAMIVFSSKGLFSKEICTKVFFLTLGLGLFIVCILFIT